MSSNDMRKLMEAYNPTVEETIAPGVPGKSTTFVQKSGIDIGGHTKIRENSLEENAGHENVEYMIDQLVSDGKLLKRDAAELMNAVYAACDHDESTMMSITNEEIYGIASDNGIRIRRGFDESHINETGNGNAQQKGIKFNGKKAAKGDGPLPRQSPKAKTTGIPKHLSTLGDKKIANESRSLLQELNETYNRGSRKGK